MDDRYITTRVAAKRLGKSRRWIEMLAERGDIPSYRPAQRLVLIERRGFEDYCAKQTAEEISLPETPPGPAPESPSPLPVPDLPRRPAGTLIVDLSRFG